MGETEKVPYDVMLQYPEEEEGGTYREEFKNQINRLKMMRAVAREQMLKAQERNATQYNKKITNKEKAALKEGDMVWLWNPVVPSGMKCKLKELWHGPFKNIAKIV